jgi:hypothetical protein
MINQFTETLWLRKSLALAMVELDFLQGLRFFFIGATVLAGVGALLFAYHQTKAAADQPKSKYGRAALFCGIALTTVLAIALFEIDTEIIYRQDDAMVSLESDIERAEEKAKEPLNDNQLAILSTVIKPFAGTAYEVVAAPCADGNLVMKLNNALSASRWKFVGASLPATVTSQADAVKIQYSQASNLQSAVDTLVDAMRAAGLNPTTELADGKSADVGPNIIRISIGAKSQ